MLIRDNFRQQFYEVVKKGHVLLLANMDVDALCAAWILMHLFTCDDVVFSLVPVTGWDMLIRAIEEHAEQAPNIVLLNCGGNRPLTEIQIPDAVKIFIIDTRRPFDIDNIFAEENIRILIKSTELETLNLPHVNDIYQSDSESSDGDDGDDNEGRRRTLEDIERRAIKRTQRQKWKRRRADILWEYYETSWYSLSISVLMLEIAHELGKSSAEIMWSAVVGLNSQLVDNLISLDTYTTACIDRLRSFIRRYSPRETNVSKGDDAFRISFDRELPLPLYSHWSLLKSMTNHDFFVCRTQYWQQRGESNIRSLLATLGLTLTECNQLFCAMSQERRTEVFKILDKEIDSNFASFTAITGFRKRFTACDFARALCNRLEVKGSDDETPYDRFSAAMNIIKKFLDDRGELVPLLRSIKMYKENIGVVTLQVFNVVNQSQILPSGPFFLLSVPHSENSRLLSSRHFLFMFSKFVQKAFNITSRSRNRSLRPLIISIPMSGEDEGWYIVTGCMPLGTDYADSNCKSFIGRAFERVVERTNNLYVRRDYFEPAVISVKSEDRTRFFDGLQAILETIT